MDDEINPYQPPKTDDVVPPQLLEPGHSPLASRGRRFGAALLDGLILMVIIIPVQLVLGLYDGFPEAVQQPTLLQQFVTMGAIIAGYTVINGKFLAQSGQTIGKKALDIRIVNVDGSQPSLTDLVAKRYVPYILLGSIPVVGQFANLINVLLIFGVSHRCGHDYIAGTKVIKAQ